MSCTTFESDIALFVGGDLPEDGMARVARHLADCADCRALMEELRASQALLGELRDEPMEEVMLARVRHRVLAEIATPRPSRRLYWKLALAAAVVLAAILGWPRNHGVKPGPVVARVVPPPVVQTPPAQIAPAKHRVRRRHRRAPSPQSGEPLLVQFVTNDPNIVIYWLVDQKPQGD